MIVRTYSADVDVPARSSTMARRATSLANGTIIDGPPPQLPSVHDFSINGILEAIDPDIQGTLDAIAEIWGRSKLSLANEYGSHRPPLGEIRASGRSLDHGLLTVEEASLSNKRLVDDNVVIVGEDTSTVDGRGHYSSTYGLLENLHQPSSILGSRTAMLPSLGDGFLRQPHVQLLYQRVGLKFHPDHGNPRTRRPL